MLEIFARPNYYPLEMLLLFSYYKIEKFIKLILLLMIMSVWEKDTGKIVGLYDIFEYRRKEEALKDLKEVLKELNLNEPLYFNEKGLLVYKKEGSLKKRDVDETISFSQYGKQGRERGILTITILDQERSGYGVSPGHGIDSIYPIHHNILISKLLKEKFSKK